jgi:hypothetical protein
MEQQEGYTGGPPEQAGPVEQAQPNGPAGTPVQAEADAAAASQPQEAQAAPPEEQRQEAAGRRAWQGWIRANWPVLAGVLVVLAAAISVLVFVQRRRRAELPEGIVDLALERSRRLMRQAARRTRALEQWTPRLSGAFPGLRQARLPAVGLDRALPRLPRAAAWMHAERALPFQLPAGRAGSRRMRLGAAVEAGVRQAGKHVRGLLAAA